MKKINLKKSKNILYPFVSLGLFVLLWLVIAKIVDIEMILPTPGQTMKEFFILLGEGRFWQGVGGTLWRTFVSFLVSFVLALGLAVASYLWTPVYKLLSPVVTLARALPTMSIILLAVIWLSANTSPMLIAGLIVFPLLYAGFYGALQGVSKDLIYMANLYRVPKKSQIKTLYIPAILPALFTAVQSAVSLNVKVLIAAEVMAQTKNSMGNYMQLSRLYLDTAELLAWTVAAVLLSYLLELCVSLIKKAVIRWEVQA